MNNKEIKCAVCGNTYMPDENDLYPCPFCGWYNDFMCMENEDKVIYRNLISFNKAKELYREGKSLKPSLYDFLDALYFYSEVGFFYKNYNCIVYLNSKENIIELIIENKDINDNKKFIFLSREDFINNAKIDDEFLKDIWEKIEDPCYL